MAENVTKPTVLKSLIWTFLEKGGSQGIQLIISIILARLLAPAEYGIIALVAIFIQLATAFIQTGFGTALIQKQEVNHVDFSTVLYLSLFISVICYTILFFAAPFIAAFYNQEILIRVVRILGLSCFSTALTCPQYAYIAKYMEFKKRFYGSTTANFVSGIAGVILAYTGFGVWALVVQQLLYGYIAFIILFITVKWRPTFAFSFEKMKYVVKFSYKLLFSTLLGSLTGGLNGLIIGKFFSGTQLGIYSKGQHFPNFVASNLIGAIQTVSLPTLSAFNSDSERLKKITRRFISLSSYVLMPCMFGLSVVAAPLVETLLSETWIDCIPYLQISCFSFMFSSIIPSLLSAINALGRSDVFLKLEVIKDIIAVIALIITAPLGMIYIALGQVVVNILLVFIYVFPCKTLLGYTVFEVLQDLLPSLLLSICMAILVYPIQFLHLHNILILVLQILVGIATYIGLSLLFKYEPFFYILKSLKHKD